MNGNFGDLTREESLRRVEAGHLALESLDFETAFACLAETAGNIPEDSSSDPEFVFEVAKLGFYFCHHSANEAEAQHWMTFAQEAAERAKRPRLQAAAHSLKAHSMEVAGLDEARRELKVIESYEGESWAALPLFRCYLDSCRAAMAVEEPGTGRRFLVNAERLLAAVDDDQCRSFYIHRSQWERKYGTFEQADDDLRRSFDLGGENLRRRINDDHESALLIIRDDRDSAERLHWHVLEEARDHRWRRKERRAIREYASNFLVA